MDRENVINLVQMHSLIQLIARYENPSTPELEASVAKSGFSALLEEIETHVPRGEA